MHICYNRIGGDMNSIINFPKRLKYSKINPLEDFYSKCLIALNKSSDLTDVQVWAFTVNPKDYKKLKDLVKKYVKKQYSFLPYKKIKFTVELIMLDIGPRVNKVIHEGFVEIDKEKLYEIGNA
jgi:hypothetical protein